MHEYAPVFALPPAARLGHGHGMNDVQGRKPGCVNQAGGAASTDPRRGRLACHSRMAVGRHTDERPKTRSGAGAWPRVT
jgi:hypothetical protein